MLSSQWIKLGNIFFLIFLRDVKQLVIQFLDIIITKEKKSSFFFDKNKTKKKEKLYYVCFSLVVVLSLRLLKWHERERAGNKREHRFNYLNYTWSIYL
jgi:hypothetical protein